MTLNDAFGSYINSRKDLRPGTVIAYTNAYKHAAALGDFELAEIRYSNIKNLYLELRYERGLKPRTIELINSVLHPIFTTALRDQIITYNPVEGALHEVARGDAWQKENKQALSKEDQGRFMEFIRTSPQYQRWETLFVFFLGTGCRVGEAIGMRWEDIDFKEGLISVNHSVNYVNGQLVEGPPKTRAGYRNIPMLTEVKKALKKEMKIQKVFYGKATGYVFKNGLGTPHIPATINQAINNAINAYNMQNKDTPLPHFSVHQLRHTFCTRLCEQETNLKVIQSVMGHSDIKTTMNVYANVTEEKKAASFAKIDGKIFIG